MAVDPSGQGGAGGLEPERDVSRFFAQLPPGGGLLGLDVTRKRVGLARTDPTRRVVAPVGVLTRADRRTLYATLEALRREHVLVGLVIGLPLDMDGGEGAAARDVVGFARRLGEIVPIASLLYDERLTSFAVEDAIQEGRMRPPPPGEPRDHLEAAVILSDALAAYERIQVGAGVNLK